MAFPVAVAQPLVEPGDPQANLDAVLFLIADAAAKGARLTVFPEACISDLYRGAEQYAASVPGELTEIIRANLRGTTVALPILENAKDGRVHSSCVLIGAVRTQVIARKTHFWRDPFGSDSFQDKDVLAPGDALSVTDVDGVRLGVLLGFDCEFPECYRALALRGADLILAAHNRHDPDLHFLCAMAKRNKTPILVAARLGFKKVYPPEPELNAMNHSLLQDKDGVFLARCKGGSALIDADGQVVARPRSSLADKPPADPSLAELPSQALIITDHFQEEDVLLSSFKLDELRVARLASPLLAELRPELY